MELFFCTLAREYTSPVPEVTVVRATLGHWVSSRNNQKQETNSNWGLLPNPGIWVHIALVRAMPSSCYLIHFHYRWNYRCRHHSTLKIKSGQAKNNSLIELLLKPWDVNERPVSVSRGYRRLFWPFEKNSRTRKPKPRKKHYIVLSPDEKFFLFFFGQVIL